MPEQLEPLAKFLGLSLEECFKQFLGVDWYEAEALDEVNIFLISPAVTKMNPGEEFAADPTGRCVFFKDGRCSIHPVKPHECSVYDHTIPKGKALEMRKIIPATWALRQDLVVKLLGREPVAAPPSTIFDIIDGF